MKFKYQKQQESNNNDYCIYNLYNNSLTQWSLFLTCWLTVYEYVQRDSTLSH